MKSESAKAKHIIIEKKIMQLMRDTTTTQLPNENELAIQFSASRNTVREALNNLTKKGLVRRRKGQGTFFLRSVLNRSMPLNMNSDFTELLRHAGYTPKLSRETVQYKFPGPKMQALMNLAPEEVLVEIRWVFYADEDPAIITKQWIPKKFFHTIPENETGVGEEIDDWDFFTQFTNQKFSHVIFEFDTSKNRKISHAFGLEKGRTMLQFKQESYNAEDQVIAHSKIYLNPDIVHLSMASKI